MIVRSSNELVNAISKKSLLKRIYEFFFYVGIFNTLYFNLRVFSLKTALKLPVLLGKRVQLQGLYKGCVSFSSEVNVKYGIVEFGISRFPIFSTKGAFSLLRFFSKSHITFGENILFHSGCSVIASKGGHIKFGSDTLFNQNSFIYSESSITFGNHFRCGWNCQVLDTDFHYVYNQESEEVRKNTKPIVFGQCCWIANHVMVSKGTVVPDFSIVAAGSLLNSDLSNISSTGNLFAGRPATLKKSGLFRVFNVGIEKQLRKLFKEADSESGDVIKIKDGSKFFESLIM